MAKLSKRLSPEYRDNAKRADLSVEIMQLMLFRITCSRGDSEEVMTRANEIEALLVDFRKAVNR